jgi:UDP-N-acetylmuramoyl-tripeptide--D-alanyl-D-alanine ligase
MSLKTFGRNAVCRVLEWQVKRLRKRHNISVVAVAGSVGKTSTKAAVARVLAAGKRVRWQEGNYNHRATVPLIFFGQTAPNILNAVAWLKIFFRNEQALRRDYPYDVVVVELGTDGPGFIAEFAYLKPELAIVTAVAPEHMEFFGGLDAVAKEELAVMDYARQTLVNTDAVAAKYLRGREYISYGLRGRATYQASKQRGKGLHGQSVLFKLADEKSFTADIPLLGEHGISIVLAAAAAAHLQDMGAADIKKGLASVATFAGRMQLLHGIKNSTIIDDTYNASPVAVKAALDVLYSGDAPQRIAILGNMNELGEHSAAAHREVGAYCDPKKLDLIVTIGADAEAFLAPAAKKRGCHVVTLANPYKAGEFVRNHLKPGAIILAKGSQNRVFAEEALKTLLANPKDQAKLVRQSSHWMNIKRKQFKP